MELYATKLDAQKRDVRLLILKAGACSAQICCVLSATSLNDRPTYEALSYVWGSLSDPQHIEINGRSIAVTANLYSALSHLRHPVRDRCLWVDAICIDQQNTTERNTQVSMMGEIYGHAQFVMIWLGEADENSDMAFDYMPRVDAMFLETKDASLVWSFFINATWRPYLSRMWVIQEFVLAKVDPIVYCGHKKVPWSILMAAYKKLALKFFTEIEMVKPDSDGGPPEILAKLKYDLFDELRTRVNHNKGADIRELLLNSRSSEATEPRDRIYGLLGMLDDNDRKNFNVDYTKPVARVFAEAMALIVKGGQGPRFISGMWCPSKPNPLVPNLPSWVPDFTSQTAEKAAPFLTNMSFNPPFPRSASGVGQIAQNGTVMEDFETLRVEALPVDVVKDVTIFADEIDNCIAQLEDIEERVRLACSREISDEKLGVFYLRYRSAEPLWRTLISDKLSGYDPAPASFEAAYQTMSHNKSSADTERDQSSYASHDLSNYRRALSSHLPRRAFFTTNSGLYGLGTTAVSPGDCVTIWFGSNTPFIVRYREDDSTKCVLVGAAYVSGIMEGEMVDELYCEDLLDSITLYVS